MNGAVNTICKIRRYLMLQTCNWSKNNTMNMVEILRQLILSNKETIKLGGRTDFLS